MFPGMMLRSKEMGVMQSLVDLDDGFASAAESSVENSTGHLDDEVGYLAPVQAAQGHKGLWTDEKRSMTD